MSKRKETRKTAYFQLEPDGFSIHTFEISRRITSSEYYMIKDKLYRQQEQDCKRGWLYPDDYGNHICTRYAKHGIRTIKLEHNESDKMDTYFIRMVVNPRKLIDPQSSYIGILPPEESSIKKLRKAFAALFNVEKKSGTSDTVELLWQLMQESEDRITDHFSRCFPDICFVQMEELEQRIQNSTFRKKDKEVMLELAAQLQRMQSVDRALEKMSKAGYDTDGLLDRFKKLDISPIPLWKNFCARQLPGPVELLRAVSSGEISVEYLNVKYK